MAHASSTECATPSAGHVEADLLHRRLEERAVLGLRDRLGPRAEHLDAEALEHPLLVELHREVQRRLPAERRQEAWGRSRSMMAASVRHSSGSMYVRDASSGRS
jgi:hypothetical protein